MVIGVTFGSAMNLDRKSRDVAAYFLIALVIALIVGGVRWMGLF